VDNFGAGNFPYNLRFPGQYKDSETGLNYNYFRDYNPTTGRYVQSDPIGLGPGINAYA
jgi:RHS repeat-associated protein